ncbi:Imm53 family immunity protein [Nocardia brevicatena]|uniref:Imm53 family immunity protein n=1 Tax=Nocardia brevicatena TaxID=37327 RepID=UPI0002DAD529|nr:Imm53 family immunity protein [Nocardia brevicatena]
MASPRFGEVRNARSGSVLPGGMLCLIVSSDDYHRIRRQYIIVEVVSELLSGDAIICDLGPVGAALTGAPFTVGSGPAHREFRRKQVARGEHDWVHAWTDERSFHLACGPENLTESLMLFRAWTSDSRE